MHKVKRLVQWSLVAFVVYAIFTSPDRAGTIVHTAWDIVTQAFASLGSFFDALLNKKK